MHCPYCYNTYIVKNGGLGTGIGTQKYRCKSCGRQFVEHPKYQAISHDKKNCG